MPYLPKALISHSSLLSGVGNGFWRSLSAREFTTQQAALLSKRAGFSSASARLQRTEKSYVLFITPVSLSAASGHCQPQKTWCFSGQALHWTAMNHIRGEARSWEALSECNIQPIRYIGLCFRQTHMHFTLKQLPETVGKPMVKPVLSCNPTDRVLRRWQSMDSTLKAWILTPQFNGSNQFTKIMPQLVTWESFQVSKHKPWLWTISCTAGSCPYM